MPRNAYVDHDNKIVLFWSPKCACSSTVSIFCDNILGGVAKGKKRTWLKNNGYHIHPTQIEKALGYVFCGYKSVAVVRNPYSRIVSSYINKFYFYQGNGISSFECLERFSKNLYHYCNKGNLENYQGLSFELFLDEILGRKKKGRTLDPHWDTQMSESIISDISFDYIVKCESFELDMKYFCDSEGFEFKPLPRVNETNYPSDFSKSSLYFGCISSVDILSDKIALGKDNLLSCKTVKLINEIYQVDFDNLPYNKIYM
ncbi:sulfotransferase family 2 domain-containing protein [Vibrio astriarenae]